jgi:hypothetical protein
MPIRIIYQLFEPLNEVYRVSNDPFEYDVASSFLYEDEPLATELNDLIQDRLATFLYSKKQEKVAGTDGEQTLGEVFGKKARVVVVLFRDGTNRGNGDTKPSV